MQRKVYVLVSLVSAATAFLSFHGSVSAQVADDSGVGLSDSGGIGTADSSLGDAGNINDEAGTGSGGGGDGTGEGDGTGGGATGGGAGSSTTSPSGDTVPGDQSGMSSCSASAVRLGSMRTDIFASLAPFFLGGIVLLRRKKR